MFKQIVLPTALIAMLPLILKLRLGVALLSGNNCWPHRFKRLEGWERRWRI